MGIDFEDLCNLDNATLSPKVPGYYICIGTYRKREIDSVSLERFTAQKIKEFVENPSNIYMGPVRIPEVEELEKFFKTRVDNDR